MNKHPDDYVFGMDKDIQDKMRAKFDPERQAQCQAWIEELTGEQFDKEFHPALKDGMLLCKALNKIKPKSVRKINKGKMAFTQRENIVNYLNGCKKLGMTDQDCFVTQDLFEGDNMVAVIDQIFALGACARKVKGFDGPHFGIKFSDENKRHFTKEQIAAGKAIVPLQNAGSIEVEKSKGTDHIVMYAKAGTELGKASSAVSQQNSGSLAIDKGKGTDHIVMYGKVGQQMGKSVGGVSQQNSGSLAVDKGQGTDHIVRYGKVGQEMGESVGGTSQLNEGSLSTSKDKKLDSVSRALN